MNTALYALRGLTHVYRDTPVLSVERLDLARGGIIGVIGPNGSGKSTFLRLAGFIEKPTQGTIVFNGKPASPFATEIRNRVALLPQEPFLMKRTVWSNVAYGLKIRKDLDRLEQRIQTALFWVGLDAREFAKRPSYALSGGEAQRVALAARLILKPEVLLLDEPTASIDALSAQLIKDAALRARSEWGTTLIVASHDWQWLYEVSDTALHLYQGRFIGTGRENILFGSWEAAGPGRWGKSLADGQHLRVPEPPAADSAAVIEDIRAIGEGPPASGSGECIVSGIVTRLALEKSTGAVRASVLVAGLPLTVVLSQQQVRERRIYPGLEVRLAYDPSRIRWI